MALRVAAVTALLAAATLAARSGLKLPLAVDPFFAVAPRRTPSRRSGRSR